MNILQLCYEYPHIITTHGSDVPGYNPDRFVLMHKVLKPFWRKVVGSASMVVCLSRFLESLLKKSALDAVTTVMPCKSI